LCRPDRVLRCVSCGDSALCRKPSATSVCTATTIRPSRRSSSSPAAPATVRACPAKISGVASRSGSTNGSSQRPKPPSAVPDVLAPGLRVVFCGINPGRVSDAARAHFANPRNDFWRLLHAARFTSRLYDPSEQFDVLQDDIGITNAAYRTTPGSGDLRKRDFDLARLERIAHELKPAWLGFVGKEAYRGLFGERPELGVQERRIGKAQLFVLPSTSPANAAVPWRERLRWFHALAGRASGLPMRQAVRALVVDPDRRLLLLHYANEYDSWWITPGGGIDAGETDHDALRRELGEEIGLEEFEIGPLLWEQERYFMLDPAHCGQRNRVYLVRVPAMEARVISEADEARWFTLDEVAALPDGPYDLDDLLSSASDW
jgi:double-stranded uracil-DNA glycosylase